MKNPKVSIIIPVKAWNNNLDECLKNCEKLDYPDFEVILLPDHPLKVQYKSVRVIPTGEIGPSEKRDLGIKHSNGVIIAFLDDDAYPVRSWLSSAVKHFDNPEIGGVGGPAVTPPTDNLWQQASGAVFESFLASAHYVYRYLPRKMRDEDDYPTVNFIVPRAVIDKIGGFDNIYWPGEDTVLCLKITHELKKRIIYDPSVLVYHHRRELFKGHLKQVGNYALHRGFFVKKFPQTSLRPGYFVPSVFVVWLIAGGVFALFFNRAAVLYFTVNGIYALALLYEGVKRKNLRLGVLTIAGIFVTHLLYGTNFIRGLLAKELKR
ncbi:MAG: glycosyltransferase [Candidatus Firestonebacteria bacterium]|nr:glycosyltransferase [Candidatus Firestonebacteria bacterium]